MFVFYLTQDVEFADAFANNRDNPVIDNFEKALDDIEKVFDNEAPNIRGLGSEMVMIFKQQIAPRRRLLIEARNGKSITDSSIKQMKEQLEPLHSVEERFSMLTRKFTNDSIRDAALHNPTLSERELAQKLDVGDFIVRSALRDQPKKRPKS